MINHQSASPARRVAWLSWRAFWAVMLALHLVPIFSGLGITGSAADTDKVAGLRLAMLLASAAFFALKMADVRWLRLKPGWRSAVASAAIIGLLHMGAVDRALGTDFSASPQHLTAVLLTGGLLTPDSAWRRLQALRSFWKTSSVVRHSRAPRGAFFVVYGWEDSTSLFQHCYASPCSLRGPPSA
jgi:hypothetical protein